MQGIKKMIGMRKDSEKFNKANCSLNEVQGVNKLGLMSNTQVLLYQGVNELGLMSNTQVLLYQEVNFALALNPNIFTPKEVRNAKH